MSSPEDSFHTFEVLRQCLANESPTNNTSSASEGRRSIEEIPQPFQAIFSSYPEFNAIQSKVLDDVLYTDKSIIISAPTGSGKTVIFELAIVKLLSHIHRVQTSEPLKIVYICPVKALCEERLVDWHKKFSNFGLNAISVTGDSDNIEFKDLLNHNLIITTPEKWDCLTRNWRENVKLVEAVKLFMIDEVHLLNEDVRGSTLETIVCRMKTIQDQFPDAEKKIRFLAVSATVPNIEDVAEWIDKSGKCFKLSEEYRPVKLNKIIIGYPETQKSTPFKFDMSLNYKLQGLILKYSNGKPTLIFCSTRKIVEMTANHLLHNLTINLKPEQKESLLKASASISDGKLGEVLIHGVGYHHAGMLPNTRKTIENLFREGHLPILVTTSTLAMGVNLPAHLVIIKSTKCYGNGGFRDYSETVLLQMIGRAGRPQYDTEATALVLTTANDKKKFERMIGGHQPIESNLHNHLIEHLNAEVVLQTITEFEGATRWLSSTFLYIRARKNPRFYGLTSSDPAIIDKKLLEICQIELNKLIKSGMLTIEEDMLLTSTFVGAAMAKYYLDFETMKLFTEVRGDEILQKILNLVSKCHEFSQMYLRVNDKKCLNLLNKCRNRETIRFPLNGKIKTLDMKINCIIQAVLGCLDICDHSLITEALNIMRNGERITKCLMEYLESKDKCFVALRNTIILTKCLHAKLWENSPYVSKQLPGVGTVISSQLIKAGKTSFSILAGTDPREIEMILGKKPPFGNKILEYVSHLPKYEVKLEIYGKCNMKITISLLNASDLEKNCTVNKNSLMHLLVGDSSNEILLYEKYSHLFLMENPEVVREMNYEEKIESIEAHFISEDFVGIDVATTYECLPKPKTVQPILAKPPTPFPKKVKKDNLKYMQTFMDAFTKYNKKEVENKENISNKENNSKIIIHGNVTIVDKSDVSFADAKKVEIKPLNKEVKNLKVFQRTPRKLSHKPVESKNDSKVTWKSPLFSYSPQNKFSPRGSQTNLIKDKSLLKNPTRSIKTLNFALSDEASASQASAAIDTLKDFVSSQFLDTIISPKPKDLNSMKAPNEYYTQLMTPHKRKNESESSFISKFSSKSSDSLKLGFAKSKVSDNLSSASTIVRPCEKSETLGNYPTESPFFPPQKHPNTGYEQFKSKLLEQQENCSLKSLKRKSSSNDNSKRSCAKSTSDIFPNDTFEEFLPDFEEPDYELIEGERDFNVPYQQNCDSHSIKSLKRRSSSNENRMGSYRKSSSDDVFQDNDTFERLLPDFNDDLVEYQQEKSFSKKFPYLSYQNDFLNDTRSQARTPQKSVLNSRNFEFTARPDSFYSQGNQTVSNYMPRQKTVDIMYPKRQDNQSSPLPTRQKTFDFTPSDAFTSNRQDTETVANLMNRRNNSDFSCRPYDDQFVSRQEDNQSVLNVMTRQKSLDYQDKSPFCPQDNRSVSNLRHQSFDFTPEYYQDHRHFHSNHDFPSSQFYEYPSYRMGDFDHNDEGHHYSRYVMERENEPYGSFTTPRPRKPFFNFNNSFMSPQANFRNLDLAPFPRREQHFYPYPRISQRSYRQPHHYPENNNYLMQKFFNEMK